MTDTISAISTGISESGIGIIRVSGPESFDIAQRVLRSTAGGRVELSGSHRVRHAYIVRSGRGDAPDQDQPDPDPGSDACPRVPGSDRRGPGLDQRATHDIVSRETLDEVLVVYMRGPGTYTGEDTVEINCHGGVLMMRRVLETVLAAGARLALPGEFTRRAFLNGRMDLAEAEAVADIIAARSDAAIRASARQLRGSVSGAVRELRAGILEDSAYIEAVLDDPEHFEKEDLLPALAAHIEEWTGRLKALISSYERGKFLREGVATAIVGRPNVGKSSLLNAMLGEERAIVTDIAGTTRDTISESVTSGDININLIDTAGIRKSGDAIERLGTERTAAAIEAADLVLLVVDGAGCLTPEDLEAAGLVAGSKARAIVILNKSDLGIRLTREEAAALLPGKDPETIELSALTGDGIDRLFDLIGQMFTAGELATGSEVVISSLRHKELLARALAALKRVADTMAAGLPEDFYTIDLMEAYRALGEILGEEVGEDLIDEIFSRFCMGK